MYSETEAKLVTKNRELCAEVERLRGEVSEERARRKALDRNWDSLQQGERDATARAEAAEKEALDYIDYRNQAVIIRNAMERRLQAAESLVAGLRGALDESRKGNEELDGTDAAHPAWWRGNDAGVAQVCAQINAILDGADVFGTAAEPWESTRRRVAEARRDSERMRWILCNCELVHAGKLRNGNPVYFESLEELDAARGTK